jgi:uncharacterized protein (DUF58 family)
MLRPRWRPSGHAIRLLSLAALALPLGILVGRPAVIALSVPGLCALALGRRPPGAVTAQLHTVVEPARSFEDEPVDVRVDVTVQPAELPAALQLRPGPAFATAAEPLADGTGLVSLTATGAPRRWGRCTVGRLDLAVADDLGLWLAADVVDPVAELLVYPRVTRTATVPVLPRRSDRFGDRPLRRPGAGVEFLSVRPFTAGDSPRRVNWPVTLRRGFLHVDEFAVERAVDVVLVLDAFVDLGPAGVSSLDIGVRAAASLAGSLLRTHDRVGVVAIGGVLRWLTANVGAHHLYRVAEAVADVRVDLSYVDPDVTRVPRTALPSGATLIVFSPLVDDRMVTAITDLRGRGFPVLVVDTLQVEPPGRADQRGQLAARLWRLDRLALHHDLLAVGARVLRWNGSDPLPALLAPLLRQPLPGGVR